MSTRTSDEALADGGTQGSMGVAQPESHLFAASAAADKVFYTFRARLACAGHALSRTDIRDGARTYFVSRWGMLRELRDLDAVEAFAKQVGGKEHG